MIVYLGNAAVHEVHHEETAPEGAEDWTTPGYKVLARADLGESVTVLTLPDDMGLRESLAAVAGAWPYHSSQPPAWVASEDAFLAQALGREFGATVRPLDDVQISGGEG